MELKMYEMFDGLTNQHELAKFNQAISAMAEDFKDEGFDKEDILEYLQLKLKRNVRSTLKNHH